MAVNDIALVYLYRACVRFRFNRLPEPVRNRTVARLIVFIPSRHALVAPLYFTCAISSCAISSRAISSRAMSPRSNCLPGRLIYR